MQERQVCTYNAQDTQYLTNMRHINTDLKDKISYKTNKCFTLSLKREREYDDNKIGFNI